MPVTFTKDLLQAVSQLELRAQRNLTALLAGNYRSSFRGSGMQFKEFRRYEPGDDIRHMSWTVTARTGHPTVKLFEEERELDVVVVVDVSGSSLFGYTKKRKIDMYSELVALIGLAAVRSGDNVGMQFFTDEAGFFLPPKRSRNHVMVGLSNLLGQELHRKKSDLRPVLQRLHSVLKNRSLILVLSDFFVPDFEDDLMLLSQRNEIVLLHCYDDAERGMGIRDGVFEICDPETGEFLLLDGRSKSTRDAMAAYHTQMVNKLDDLTRRCRADYLSLSVEDEYLQRLVQFFRQRGPSRL